MLAKLLKWLGERFYQLSVSDLFGMFLVPGLAFSFLASGVLLINYINEQEHQRAIEVIHTQGEYSCKSSITKGVEVNE